MLVPAARHPGYTPRRTAGLTAYERVLARAGLTPVAGIDEAGRGACAGPLVVAAVALDPRRLAHLSGVADSKALSAAAREQAYAEVMTAALGWHVVVIPPQEIDARGLHVCNIAGMRRALAGLSCRPSYVLTDGFPVRGLGIPALAMWKGDEVAACVAAASVVAKVSRDRLMRELDRQYPVYGFARHKGYSTPSHMRALTDHGPCPEHRRSFINVSMRLADRLHLAMDELIIDAHGPALPTGPAGRPGAECSVPADEGYGLNGDGPAGGQEGRPGESKPPDAGRAGLSHPLPAWCGDGPWPGEGILQGGGGSGPGLLAADGSRPLGHPEQEN